jgi:hypothetical protein
LEKQIMIRNNKLLIAAGAAALSASIYSATSFAGTVTADATANVLEPLGITVGTNIMDFGDVAADPVVATTVVLDPAGTTSSNDGASVSGAPTAGDFDVTGEANAFYDITLPANDTVILTGTGGPDMFVQDFTADLGTTGQLDGTGAGSFTVGATLELGINQGAGTYDGTYDVTVNYQ